MNIPFTQVVYEDESWTYTWAPGLGAVRVVLWGELLTTIGDDSADDTFYTYTSDLYTSNRDAPPVEVVLDGEFAASERNRCFLILQWLRSNCVQYEIERKQGGTWKGAGLLLDDPLIRVYTHTTELLVDQTTAEWRVVAVDANKRESDPLEWSYKIVRPPNPPAWDDVTCVGGTLTVE